MTRNLARALAGDRIRANLLNPGWVISEGEVVVQAKEGHDADWIAAMGQRQPLGRHQVPEDAALAAVFLASDESSQVTGVELNCDAGRSCGGARHRIVHRSGPAGDHPARPRPLHRRQRYPLLTPIDYAPRLDDLPIPAPLALCAERPYCRARHPLPFLERGVGAHPDAIDDWWPMGL